MKSTYAFFLITAGLFFACCNHEVEVIQDTVTLEDFGVKDEDDKYSISAQKDTLLSSPNGIGVFINGSSFVDEQGNPVEGEVQIVIKDLTKLSEMFTENMSTLSPEGMLETRGMIKIDAYADGKPLALKEGAAIDLFFPGDPAQYADADIYYGYEDEDGVIKWVKEENQQLRQEPIRYDERIELLVSVDTDWKYNDIIEGIGFFEQDSMASDLQDWLELSESEIEAITDNPVVVRWILFSDGDLEVYNIRGDVSKRIKNKIVKKLNAMPAVAPYHREGGAAEVSGRVGLGARLVRPEVLNSFTLRTYRLGWTNCDVFIRNNAPLVNMTVDTPNPKAMMRLVFDDYKTVVAGVMKSDGKVYFEGIADSTTARLITIYPAGESVNLSIQKISIQDNLEAPKDFEKVSKRELEKRLNELI